MPSSKPALRLRDIVASIDAILQDVGGMSEADFIGDRFVHDAVLYRLLRLSEAARKLGDLAEELVPDQPWPQIRAFGNAIRHEYDEIRLEQVWVIVRRDLPPLFEACNQGLARLLPP